MSKSDQEESRERPHPGVDEDEVLRPVLIGLVALVAVTLAVGLIVGGGALMATRVLGLGGGTSGGGAQASTGSSLHMPDPVETTGPDGPAITLGPGDIPDATDTGSPVTEAPEGITLTASPDSVTAMGSVTLSGTHPTGEGAILQVQRQDETGWSDFPVVVSVVGGRFSTAVQSALVGKNVFRVVDTDTGAESASVEFTVR